MYINLGFYVEIVINCCRYCTIYLLSTHKVITTGSIDYSECNAFRLPYKSIDNSLIDVVKEIQDVAMHSTAL